MIVRINCLLLFFCLLQSSISTSEELYDGTIENRAEDFIFSTPTAVIHPTFRPMRVNCTPPIIEQFPRSSISMLLKRHPVAATFVHTLVVIYALVSMILIYKNHFLLSINLICKEQKYSPSVIGATFMAVGSSMPEFAKNIVGVFIAKDDIGVSGVFPSVFYNIPYVLMIGICSFFASKEYNVNCWPFYRDSLFYILSILALVFATFEHVIVWWKCVIILLIYVVYCIVLCLNPILEKFIHSFSTLSKCCRKNEPSDCETELSIFTSGVDTNVNEVARQSDQQNVMNEDIDFNTDNEFSENDHPQCSIIAQKFKIPPKCISIFFWITTYLFPISPLWTLIESSCKNSKILKSYKVIYVISLIWLFLFSYLMHWTFINLGSILKIPDTVLNFTLVIASASSIGIMNSVVAIKKGFADMAMSNAIGADIFSICISLGFPWFIQTTMLKPGSSIVLFSEKLPYFVMCTLISILAVMMTVCLNNQKLDSNLGRAMIGLFIIYNTLIYILNAFRRDDKPQCLTNFWY